MLEQSCPVKARSNSPALVVVKSPSGAVRNAECLVVHTAALNAATRGLELAKELNPLAKVLASIKIFPDDAGLDLESLKSRIGEALPAGVTVQRFDEEPVAFGLVALIAHVLLPEDEEGKMDQVEQAIKTVHQVSEIQVLRVGRV